MERSNDLNADGFAGRRQRRRRILRRGLIVLGGLVLAGVVMIVWAARALPRIASTEISHLTNTRVDMGAFHFHRDGSVSIDGLVVWPQQRRPSEDDAILRARNVRVRFDRRSLLRLAPRLTEIRVEDFLFDAQLDWDTGRWNLSDLRIHKPRNTSAGQLPDLILQGGKLRYSKASGEQSEVVMSVPIEAQFRSVEEPRRRYAFEIKTARLAGGYGESHLEGYWRPGELVLTGGLSSTDIPSLERAWAADVIAAQLTYDDQDDYKLNLRIRDAHNKHSPEVDAFRAIVPAALGQSGPLATLQSFFARYRPSGTVGQVTVDAQGNLSRLAQSEITGVVVCDDVSVCDRKFPYAIDHLAGRLDFTQATLLVNRLSGKHGDVDLVIDGWSRGYGEDRQSQYRVTSDNMVLDETLYAALQPEQKRLWDAFKPTGTVSVDYRLIRTSATERRKYASMELHQVAATYEKFPYPLEGLTGHLYFDNESIIATDVESQANGCRIKVDAKVTQRRSPSPIYYISVDGNDVPLDSVLAKALPDSYRRLYKEFDANGTADVHATVFTTGDANNVGPLSFFADVAATMSSLTPARLPLTLSNTSAELSITPESLSVKKLVGQYGNSPVAVTGGVRLGGDNTPEQIQLKMTAREAPVDGGLVELLPEPLKQRVAAFDAHGNVNLAIDVTKVDASSPVDYTVAVECLGDSIRHQRFAYPLQDVRGKITMRPGKVVFDGIEARPDVEGAGDPSAAIRVDGHLDLADEDTDLGSFLISARNVPFTPELGAALPGEFPALYCDLSPGGRFDLELEVPCISRTTQGKRRLDFHGNVDLQACSLNFSGAAGELTGGLSIEGAYDTGAGLSGGHMKLDARQFTIQDRAITDLKADVAFDPGTRTWAARDFIGDCYGGRVLGSLQVGRMEDQGGRMEGEAQPSASSIVSPPSTGLEYVLCVAFSGVDLQEFLAAGAADGTGGDYGSGVMNASLSLGARIGDRSSRRGICTVDVADMQVGKVSPLAGVVSVLQLNEPTEYTFDRMWIESCLKRDTLLIQKFDMAGKNTAFTGSGMMDMSSRQVELMLTARGRRVATAEPTVLQSLAEGLGGAVVRVEVTGDVGNPRVVTKTLPVIEDSLKILGTPR
jgi:hypothetical protein